MNMSVWYFHFHILEKCHSHSKIRKRIWCVQPTTIRIAFNWNNFTGIFLMLNTVSGWANSSKWFVWINEWMNVAPQTFIWHFAFKWHLHEYVMPLSFRFAFTFTFRFSFKSKCRFREWNRYAPHNQTIFFLSRIENIVFFHIKWNLKDREKMEKKPSNQSDLKWNEKWNRTRTPVRENRSSSSLHLHLDSTRPDTVCVRAAAVV